MELPECEVREILMILFVTCTTLSGQLCLKHAMTQIAARDPAPRGLDWLMASFASGGVWAAIVIQGLGFVVWMVVVSRVKLGLAFAFAGAFLYILMPLVAWQLYGERLAPMQWIGIVLISTGVLMLSMLGQNPSAL